MLILNKGAAITAGERNKAYGDPWENHTNIGQLLEAYINMRFNLEIKLDATDVAHMMTLLKIARTASGDHTPDNYVDGATYMAIAGECAEKDRRG